MVRFHFVKKARKDNPAVKKGQPYYWWKHRFGPKKYSATRPKPSQLTTSEFLGAMYDLQDRLAALNVFDVGSLEEVAQDLRDIASEVQEQGEECSSKKDNMPEGLQEGDVGQLLEERYNQCEEIAQMLEFAADEIEQLAENDEKEDSEKVSEAQTALEGIDWSFE